MNMRNFLKPGDFVIPMPIGIHIIHHKTAPAKLHITKGTTWVKGVLYTGTFVEASGVLPKSAESLLLAKFIDNPNSFNFFAATIESTSALFTGATSVRQTLAMAKFKILPGWLVPVGVSNETINDWVNSPIYTFMPIVTDYVIFRNTSVSIHSAHLVQKIVESVNSYTDFNGKDQSSLRTLSRISFTASVQKKLRPMIQ